MTVIEKFIKEKKFLFIFLFNLAIFMVCVLVRTPVFWTDDDWGIANMISGARGEGFATPYVKFVNIILSACMYYLYKVVHSINWFGTCEVIIIFLSFLFLSFYYLDKRENDDSKHFYDILLGLFLLIFAPWCYVKIQFTQTAEIGCFASALLFVYSYKHDGRKKWVLKVTSVTILIVSALYRIDCLLLVCPFVFSEGLFRILKEKNVIKEIKIYTKLLLIILAIYFGGNAIQEFAYNAWEDEGYIEFNSARASFVDYGQKTYLEAKDYLDEHGISFNDYELLCSWHIEDPLFVNIELFETLNECLVDKERTGIRGFVIEFINMMKAESYYIFLILGVVLCIINIKNVKIFIWLFGVVNAISLFFTWLGRYPSYVKNMVFIIACYLLIMNAVIEKDKKYKQALIIITMLSLFITNNQGFITTAKFSRQKMEGYETYKILNDYSDCVFVTGVFSTGGLSILKDSYSVFETPESGIQRNIIGMGGWSSRHPVSNAQHEALGIYSPMLQLPERNIYVLASPEWLMLYQQYIYEHTGTKTSFAKATNINGGSIFKFTPQELELVDVDFVESIGNTNSGYSDEIAMLAFASYVDFNEFVDDKMWNVYYQLTNVESGDVYNVMAYDYMMDTVKSDEAVRVLSHMSMNVLDYGDTFEVRVILEDYETGTMYCDYDSFIEVTMLK